MTKLTFNILLSLIIQAKKTGRGRMGNGRILVNLLMIASDYDKREKTQERSILRKFNDEQGKSDAYHKIDKFVGRFLPEGKYYPYKKFTFKELEKSTKNSVEYKIKLTQMSKLCDELFTDKNAVRLTETLLEIVRNDSHIDKLLYGGEFVSKEYFFGSPAHQKQICLEALLIALVHYITSTSDAVINCCGNRLEALTPQKADENQQLSITDIGGEWFISSDHEMTKEHYISFAAYISDSTVMMFRQYPEWNLQITLPMFRTGRIMWYCTKCGLFYQNIHK